LGPVHWKIEFAGLKVVLILKLSFLQPKDGEFILRVGWSKSAETLTVTVVVQLFNAVAIPVYTPPVLIRGLRSFEVNPFGPVHVMEKLFNGVLTGSRTIGVMQLIKVSLVIN